MYSFRGVGHGVSTLDIIIKRDRHRHVLHCSRHHPRDCSCYYSRYCSCYHSCTILVLVIILVHAYRLDHCILIPLISCTVDLIMFSPYCYRSLILYRHPTVYLVVRTCSNGLCFHPSRGLHSGLRGRLTRRHCCARILETVYSLLLVALYFFVCSWDSVLCCSHEILLFAVIWFHGVVSMMRLYFWII